MSALQAMPQQTATPPDLVLVYNTPTGVINSLSPDGLLAEYRGNKVTYMCHFIRQRLIITHTYNKRFIIKF